MSRVDDALQQLQTSAGSAIRLGNHPTDDALVKLLVHMALSDGVLDDAELRMLRRIMPEFSDDEIRAWIDQELAAGLDLPAIAKVLDTDDRRWITLRFAARMAWRDEELADEEHDFLAHLATALELPEGALDRVLREMTGPPAERLEPTYLASILSMMPWGAADFAEGDVQSTDLIPHVPPGAEPVARIGVDQSEVIGIYDRGIVARFGEGSAFLHWNRIVSCARGSGLESSVRIHTDDGRIWSLVDARLSGIGLFFDRLFRPDDPSPTGKAPAITRIRRNEDDNE